jgi:putative peptidoglycan lipid II flippase
MAFALGNTLLASAYSVANTMPNQVFELIAGGVLSSVFLPVYMNRRAKGGKRAADGYASNLLSIGLIVLGVITILATIFAPQVVFTQTFLTQGVDAEQATFFFRFFAIQILFYGVGGLFNSLLNAHREFLWPALGPIFNNIIVIATMFSYPIMNRTNPELAMIILALGTTLGVVAMFVIQVPALIRTRVKLRFRINLRDPALKESLKLVIPVTIFIVVNLVVVSVQNALAFRITPSGPATIQQYAFLWYMLPYGVIAVALSTALFTEMSQASAAQNWGKLRDNVRMGLRTTLFAIIPLAVTILVLSKQLAGLYHAGEFTADDVLIVANVLSAWCLALPFFATYRFIYRVFSSLRDLKAFIVIDLIGRLVQIGLSLSLSLGIGSWKGLGLIGIPLADAIAYILLTSGMLLLLYKRIGHFGLTRIVIDGLKIVLAAVLSALVPFIVIFFGGEDANLAVSLVKVLIGGSFTLTVFFLLCKFFQVPEISVVESLLGRVKGLFLRRNGRSGR